MQQVITGSSQSSELDIDLYNNSNVAWSKQQQRTGKNPLADYVANHSYQKESGPSTGRHPRNQMPIIYGGRQIGFRDLLQVMEAEKRGVHIELN